jgi:hypothetical protein
VTKLDDDKIYTSIVEDPEGEEIKDEETKKDELFPDEEEDDDKRSYQSEEAMKPEVEPKPLT